MRPSDHAGDPARRGAEPPGCGARPPRMLVFRCLPLLRLSALTSLTLACFAANSLLCRAALGPRRIDPATFTSIRIASGAAVLALLLALGRRTRPAGGSWMSAAALFLYAAAFSLSYVRIGAGVGALLLFAAVQVTMVGWTMLRGVRPHPVQLVGIGLALAGLVWLTLPGSSAPEPAGRLGQTATIALTDPARDRLRVASSR